MEAVLLSALSPWDGDSGGQHGMSERFGCSCSVMCRFVGRSSAGGRGQDFSCLRSSLRGEGVRATSDVRSGF